jgi:spore germination protein GerM
MLKPESNRLLELKGLSKEEAISSIISELKVGPELDNTISPLPPNLILKNIWTKDGIAYLDFSKELFDIEKKPYIEYNLVFAIVKSIVANIEGIKAVVFMVNGKQIDTIKGFLDLTHPITPKDDIYIRRKNTIINEKE